jgi:adenosylmethionine-8-amino-7-oxononanoate aminotransferase
VRALTQQHGVLLIVDEVATGFGRTGTLFACEQENVTPDLLCLAKGLSGGYLPVAATLATNAIWQAFLGPYAASKTFFHGHTYGGNPLGCAAALGSLRVFEEEATLAQLKPKITQLQTFLHRLAQRDDIARPRQCGLLIACDLVDPATRAPYPWEAQRGIALCRRAWELGLALRPLGNVIYLLPPLAATAEELEEACVMLTASLNQLRESDGENCLTRPQNIAQ